MFDFEIPFLPESESAYDEFPHKKKPVLNGIKAAEDVNADETWSS